MGQKNKFCSLTEQISNGKFISGKKNGLITRKIAKKRALGKHPI